MKLLVCLVVLAVVATALAVQVPAPSQAVLGSRAALLEIVAPSAKSKPASSHSSAHSSSSAAKGKLPVIPSDSKRPTKAGNEKAKPSAAAAKKVVDLKSASTKGARVAPKVAGGDHITLVNATVWAEVKAAKIGQKIEALLNKIGGKFLAKVKNFFKGVVDTLKKLNPFRLASGSSASADKICHWVVHVDDSYSSAGWSDSHDDLTQWGTYKPGGVYTGSHVDRQSSDGYDCLSGDTAKSLPVTGSSMANANFICVDSKNTMVDPPGTCRANVQFYAGYQGTTYSSSDSMWVCPIGSRHIQVTAAQEVQVQVGSAVPASKGLVTTTGNSITETYAFQFTAGAQGGTNKDGPSASANVGVSFGYTVVENKDFGEKDNIIAIEHSARYDSLPFSAVVQSISSAQINGAGRVIGSALSQTKGMYLCMVGTSVNCGMPNTAVEFGIGSQELLTKYGNACKAIKQSNNVQ